MSTTADDSSAGGVVAAYDDPEDPSELTLFSTETDHIATRWLSIDAEHALDVAEWT